MANTRQDQEEAIPKSAREMMEEVIPELYWSRLSKGGLRQLEQLCRRVIDLEAEKRPRDDEEVVCFTVKHAFNLSDKRGFQHSQVHVRLAGDEERVQFGRLPAGAKDGYRYVEFTVAYEDDDGDMYLKGPRLKITTSSRGLNGPLVTVSEAMNTMIVGTLPCLQLPRKKRR